MAGYLQTGRSITLSHVGHTGIDANFSLSRKFYLGVGVVGNSRTESLTVKTSGNSNSPPHKGWSYLGPCCAVLPQRMSAYLFKAIRQPQSSRQCDSSRSHITAPDNVTQAKFQGIDAYYFRQFVYSLLNPSRCLGNAKASESAAHRIICIYYGASN